MEATVAGGVPVIEFLRGCLASNRIDRVAGIFYDRTRVEEDEKVLSQPTLDLESLEAEQVARLGGEVRIEKRTADEESLVIPIEQAMTRAVEEAQRR